MLIEDSTVTDLPVIVVGQKHQSYPWPLTLGTFITLTATILPILFVVMKNDSPTGTLLSPIPEGVVADSRSTPTSLSSQQALTLAQNYLSKANDLLRNPNQTETDKVATRISLEKGLRLTPETAEGLGLRAEILSEIKKLLPDSSASSSADQGIIVASPGEDSLGSTTTNTPSNANENSFILPAGKAEMTIKNTQVKTNSYIYLLPVENTTTIVSLRSKSEGSFTISAEIAPTTELFVSYYIINE